MVMRLYVVIVNVFAAVRGTTTCIRKHIGYSQQHRYKEALIPVLSCSSNA